MVIDHINGNPFDNKLENLKLTSQTVNVKNRKIGVNNKSKTTGVCLTNNGQGRKYWSGFWNENNKVHQKRFSIDDHGFDQALKLACEYRTRMIEKLNKQGAGYSDRHGL